MGTLGLAVVLGAAGLWLARDEPDRLPPRVEIEGVEVGGLAYADAEERLRDALAPRLAQPVRLVADGAELEVAPRSLGAEPEFAEAFAEAEARRGPLDRIAARLRLAESVRVPLAWRFDPEELAELAERAARAVEREPRDAAVRVRAGELELVSAREGLVLDAGELERRLEALPAEVELPLRAERPEIEDGEAERALRRAERLLDDPPSVRRGQTTLALERALLVRALRFPADDGSLRVALAARPLGGPLRAAFAEYERPARPASFVVEGERVRIRRSARGLRLAVGETAEALARAGPGATVPARFDRPRPAFRTADARALRIRRLVSRFSTAYPCCQPRVTNIQRAAEILDGYVIEPGETFSLNEALGERTPERGFLSAPMILSGRLVDAVGGGVSQIATTIFNAAFFAGLELVQHTPHQLYISRYPMGREATISWGGPELVFRNDWEAGILVDAEATDTSITFSFYSAPLGRRVETETGEPFDWRAPETVERPTSSLPPGARRVVQEAGGSGFTVRYTRKVWRGDELVRDERFTTRYDPQNRIVEVGT